ncbi:MAG: sulfurtransferase [Pirellulaceae bacterium]|nr:sulfurtransferase [Pirellulaceae bacterium]
MGPLIRVDQLSDLMQRYSVVLLDARGGADARQRFEQFSLPNAVFVNLETELSAKRPNAAEGGRHPLPTAPSFAQQVATWGITPETRVVIYDDKGGANAAARGWWMFRAIGHQHVSVLDGGLAAVPADFELPPTAVGASGDCSSDFSNHWRLPTATMSEVEQAVADTNRLVIDVREGYRYRGESEPIDLVAGHIPGAINCSYTENLDPEGKFLPPHQLRAKYQELFKGRAPEQVIVHCGSGVTACHTLLALSVAGLDGAHLYVGSWSEWSRNDKPIATGS